MDIPKDLVAASSSPLVLAILKEGDSYGYGILQRVRELSDGSLEWTDGLLYPLLHRLEAAGQIAGYWGSAPTGRRRKYYRLTPEGAEALAAHQSQWRAVADTLAAAWKTMGVTTTRIVGSSA